MWTAPKNQKSFPSHRAHWAALISVSIAISQTPAEAALLQVHGYGAIVCHVGCLFKFPACTGTNLLLGKQRQCVNNLPKVEREAPRPGIEPARLRPHAVTGPTS